MQNSYIVRRSPITFGAHHFSFIMPIIPNYDLEDEFGGIIAGIDEVGRGPWAGPVVASAVILDRNTAPEGLRDSKTLSDKRLRAFSRTLWQTAQIGVGLASVEEIDKLNIARATMLAMTRAAANLPTAPTTFLVDGKFAPRLSKPAYPVIKGDSKSPSIAAASIIAKVVRDRMMRELAVEYPHYEWERNKGYGVKAHREGLDAHGVSPHHRRSFAPIHKRLQTGKGSTLV